MGLLNRPRKFHLSNFWVFFAVLMHSNCDYLLVFAQICLFSLWKWVDLKLDLRGLRFFIDINIKVFNFLQKVRDPCLVSDMGNQFVQYLHSFNIIADCEHGLIAL